MTALYEIVPGAPARPARREAASKYQREPRVAPAARGDELLTVAVRFKEPDARESRRVSATVLKTARPMTANLGFASAVAEFGMLLRGSPHAGRASYGAVIDRARRYAGHRSRTATALNSSTWPSERRSWPTTVRTTAAGSGNHTRAPRTFPPRGRPRPPEPGRLGILASSRRARIHT